MLLHAVERSRPFVIGWCAAAVLLHSCTRGANAVRRKNASETVCLASITSLGALKTSRRVQMSLCMFGGALPKEIGNLRKLKVLVLRQTLAELLGLRLREYVGSRAECNSSALPVLLLIFSWPGPQVWRIWPGWGTGFN